jgi:hypothetical protein
LPPRIFFLLLFQPPPLQSNILLWLAAVAAVELMRVGILVAAVAVLVGILRLLGTPL